jgi:hypothetical protein
MPRAILLSRSRMLQMLIRPLLFLWAVGNLSSQQAPVPDPEKQKLGGTAGARCLQGGVYAKKTAADRVALARKLLAAGPGNLDDPASRYVLLREAREVAAQAGDLSTVIKGHRIDGQVVRRRHARAQVGLLSRDREGGATLRSSERSPGLSRPGRGSRAAEPVRDRQAAAESASALARRLKGHPHGDRADAKAKEAGDRREKFAKVNGRAGNSRASSRGSGGESPGGSIRMLGEGGLGSRPSHGW